MAAYGQRVDLNNPVNRQQYGDKKKLADAQRAVPVASSPNVSAPVARPVPGERGSLTRPSERPNEPITAGAPFGAGPGPEAAGIIPTSTGGDDVLQQLIYLNQAYPNKDLADLIDAMKGQ